MVEDDTATGIPTRAIHEAYLDMQVALKRHRQASDAGEQAAIDAAHGDVQEAVLTFYELLRPHLKGNPAIDDYWEGEPPSYQGNGDVPTIDDGKGILYVQRRTRQFTLNGTDVDELESLEDWHKAVGLNDDVRVVGVHVDGEVALVQFDAYQLGLRGLDSWRTQMTSSRRELDGFMGGKTESTQHRTRVDMGRLRRAARELSDAAHDLKALSEFDAATPRTEISEELIEEVNEWRERNLT